jgi:hypothetical protein
MRQEFHFKSFEPGTGVRRKAEDVLDRIMDLAPYGSIAVALLERQDDGYRCSMDVYSKIGPFMASAMAQSAFDALEILEKRMVARIDRWKRHRFDRNLRNERPHFWSFSGEGHGVRATS